MILTLETEPRPVENWNNDTESFLDLKLHFRLSKLKGANNETLLRLSALNIGKELGLYTVSENSRHSMFSGYSIITLYISVVLVIGKLIRGALSGTYYKIIYEDMPNPSPLLKLCAGVEIARHENRLVKEGELYYELIEVLRSTELLKLITKTSKDVYTFKKEEEKEGGLTN